VIGGSEVYKLALETLSIDFISVTEIGKPCECDTYFPEIPDRFRCIDQVVTHHDDGIVTYKTFKNMTVSSHTGGCQ